MQLFWERWSLVISKAQVFDLAQGKYIALPSGKRRGRGMCLVIQHCDFQKALRCDYVRISEEQKEQRILWMGEHCLDRQEQPSGLS